MRILGIREGSNLHCILKEFFRREPPPKQFTVCNAIPRRPDFSTFVIQKIDISGYFSLRITLREIVQFDLEGQRDTTRDTKTPPQFSTAISKLFFEPRSLPSHSRVLMSSDAVAQHGKQLICTSQASISAS